MAVIANAEASLGAFMPTTIEALGAAEAGFAVPIIDIEAKLVGAAAASASIEIQPPSLELAAAIEGSLQEPGVAIDVSAMLGVEGALNADLGALNLALSLVLAVQGSLGASVQFLATEGPVSEMGQDINSILSGDAAADGIAVVLIAKESGSVAALRTLFGL